MPNDHRHPCVLVSACTRSFGLTMLFSLAPVFITPGTAQVTRDPHADSAAPAASNSLQPTVSCTSRPGERQQCAADRLNAEFIHVNRSPVGYTADPYPV